MTKAHWSLKIDSLDSFDERDITISDENLFNMFKRDFAQHEYDAILAQYPHVTMEHDTHLWVSVKRIDENMRHMETQRMFKGPITFIATIQSPLTDMPSNTYLFKSYEDAVEFKLRYS